MPRSLPSSSGASAFRVIPCASFVRAAYQVQPFKSRFRHFCPHAQHYVPQVCATVHPVIIRTVLCPLFRNVLSGLLACGTPHSTFRVFERFSNLFIAFSINWRTLVQLDVPTKSYHNLPESSSRRMVAIAKRCDRWSTTSPSPAGRRHSTGLQAGSTLFSPDIICIISPTTPSIYDESSSVKTVLVSSIKNACLPTVCHRHISSSRCLFFVFASLWYLLCFRRCTVL